MECGACLEIVVFGGLVVGPVVGFQRRQQTAPALLPRPRPRLDPWVSFSVQAMVAALFGPFSFSCGDVCCTNIGLCYIGGGVVVCDTMEGQRCDRQGRISVEVSAGNGGTYICFPPKIRRCCTGGMPSFSSTFSLIAETWHARGWLDDC